MNAKSRHRAFTIVEFMVIFGIGIILLSIFIPYLLKIRENDRRVRCQANLRQIRDALSTYALMNGHTYPRVVYDAANNPNGYTAYTGVDDDDPFGPTSTVKPNDVTASLWLLVRNNFVGPGVFICPSSGDSRDLMTGPTGRSVKNTQRGNFRNSSNLSYSYSSPFSNALGYRMDDTRKSEFAIMADKSPGNGDGGGAGSESITGPSWDASVLDRSRANSRNHGKAGQNVLYADGSVSFERTVYCGVGRDAAHPGDNIYTALAPKPLAGEQIPASGNGYWSNDIGPSWEGDSYLVPTADEGPHAARIVSAPSTTPATAPTTATATISTTIATVATTTATTAASSAPTAPTTMMTTSTSTSLPTTAPSSAPSSAPVNR